MKIAPLVRIISTSNLTFPPIFCSMIPPEHKLLLKKQGYALVGSHSAVKICEWAKKSIRGEGVCYKEKFYKKVHGIESHRCLQMTPSTYFCPNRCIYCWRATDKTVANSMNDFPEDEPKNIVEGSILAQKKLLSGFGGFKNTDQKKWKESQAPKNVAISLTGEPTAYPKISGLIDAYMKRGMTTFLVTNGQFPERLETLSREPSQLYLSLDAPTKEIYKRIDIPQFPDFWERYEKTISLFPSFSCKKAVRLTVVKGWNDSHEKEYAELIKRANPDFVEIKAYMHVGFSRYRLPHEAMPLHSEVQAFAKRVNEHLGYAWKDEDATSRVVLLGKR